jgi:exodeoxyribonuclease V alpha subunit
VSSPPPRDGVTGAAGGPSPAEADPYDARLVVTAGGLLGEFNRAGVLSPADVHVARCLAQLAGQEGEAAETVALATALAVRGPRYGHVLVDLEEVRRTVTADAELEVDLGALPWPEVADWVSAVAANPMVAVGEDAPADRPLRLIGTALYLDRNWADERTVAAQLMGRAAHAPPAVDPAVLGEGLRRLFPDPGDGDQRWAAAAAICNRLSVIAGGPGTGKTTTVARIVALLAEQAHARGQPMPLVAMAAPTGKAAARLQEAVQAETARLRVAPSVRGLVADVPSVTLHRLLGSRPGRSRFNHNHLNRLPHDVVMVDETSMVSLALMARLTEAVRPDARLVLAGDPGQLASVEAGAVLGDVVGPAGPRSMMSGAARAALTSVTGVTVAGAGGPPGDGAGGRPAVAGASFGDGIVVLSGSRRFAGPVAALASAIRDGDGDGAVAALAGGAAEVVWLPDPAGDDADVLRREALTAGARLYAAAARGDGPAAVHALGAFRVLCAHRRGPYGVAHWTERIEGWLAGATPFTPAASWYVGRPVMVTANDYALGLYNGDAGVAVADPEGGIRVAFPRPGGVAEFNPYRLTGVETVFAMTVHKAQGSEFDAVAVVLPEAGSAMLTRELLYTAVTRARRQLIVAGTEQAVRQAVARPIARASGLTRRLWGGR